MRHILLATDGSGCADRARDVAVELAKALDCKLSILTVGGHPPISEHELEQLARVEGGMGDVLDTLSDEVLAQVEKHARQAGISDIRTYTGWGNPAEVIIEIAERINADTIVMGRRGRGQLAGLLLGSVSQKTVSHSSCTVVLVP